jgi:hypothetical protein
MADAAMAAAARAAMTRMIVLAFPNPAGASGSYSPLLRRTTRERPAGQPGSAVRRTIDGTSEQQRHNSHASAPRHLILIQYLECHGKAA